jgi:hypothetical protein
MPMYWLRVLGGTLYLAARSGRLQLLMTWSARPATYEEPVHEAPAAGAHYVRAAASRVATREGHGLDLAHKIDVWQQGWWHRAGSAGRSGSRSG